MAPFPALARELLHLCAWAQAGVISRVYIGRLFGSACGSRAWVPCTTARSGQGAALFADLPANIAGCFVMGLLSATDTLVAAHAHLAHGGHLPIPAALAALPAGHALQRDAALQLGLRTGYCGSLTTFASW